MADTLPAPYGDEMKGISQATGIPLGKIDRIKRNLFDICFCFVLKVKLFCIIFSTKFLHYVHQLLHKIKMVIFFMEEILILDFYWGKIKWKKRFDFYIIIYLFLVGI